MTVSAQKTEALPAAPTAIEDARYFRKRAEQELDRARRSTEGAVASAHYRMAFAYLERLDQFGSAGETALDEPQPSATIRAARVRHPAWPARRR